MFYENVLDRSTASNWNRQKAAMLVHSLVMKCTKSLADDINTSLTCQPFHDVTEWQTQNGSTHRRALGTSKHWFSTQQTTNQLKICYTWQAMWIYVLYVCQCLSNRVAKGLRGRPAMRLCVPKTWMLVFNQIPCKRFLPRITWQPVFIRL